MTVRNTSGNNYARSRAVRRLHAAPKKKRKLFARLWANVDDLIDTFQAAVYVLTMVLAVGTPFVWLLCVCPTLLLLPPVIPPLIWICWNPHSIVVISWWYLMRLGIFVPSRWHWMMASLVVVLLLVMRAPPPSSHPIPSCAHHSPPIPETSYPETSSPPTYAPLFTDSQDSSLTSSHMPSQCPLSPQTSEYKPGQKLTFHPGGDAKMYCWWVCQIEGVQGASTTHHEIKVC